MFAIMFWMSSLPATSEFLMAAIPDLLAGKVKKDPVQQRDGLYFDDEDFDSDDSIDFGFDDDYDDFEGGADDGGSD